MWPRVYDVTADVYPLESLSAPTAENQWVNCIISFEPQFHSQNRMYNHKTWQHRYPWG